MKTLFFISALLIAVVADSGWVKQDPNSPIVKEIIEEAVKKYNAISTAGSFYIPTTITSVELKKKDYKIKMQLCESTCSKSEGKHDYSKCKPKANGKTKDVTITVSCSESGDIEKVSRIDETFTSKRILT
uniref:Cystatin domain-containing protein n=1 Tax=Panagrolaimus sp. JU765 TaxID=591449 RepID=A0AC34R3W2_9BILA